MFSSSLGCNLNEDPDIKGFLSNPPELAKRQHDQAAATRVYGF